MNKFARSIAVTAVSVFPLWTAMGCGGDVATVDKMNDASPVEIPGGGIGSGAIDGKINVYVIDGNTEEPIVGAAVRIGEPDASKPLEGITDETGLATFKDASLQGATTVTVTAVDHVAATWFGVNGANVTIPLGLTKAPAVETAQASGTIAGWDTLPDIGATHAWFALIGYSATGDSNDPANSIQQPMGMGLAPNACIRLPPPLTSPPCNWQLITRTGKQIHYAILLDVDTKGTFMDRSDDTQSVYGFAFKTGIDLQAGAMSTGETLDIFPVDSLTKVNVVAPALPAGMDTSAVIPLLDMGAEGQLPFYFGQDLPTNIPKLEGIFASGTYEFVARAGIADKPYPSTVNVLRNVNIADTVQVPDFQAPPTDLAATGGVYSFKPVADAALHTALFRVPMGDRAWAIALLDNRESFSLPTLSPDPLPVGNLVFTVSAIALPDVDLQNFELNKLGDSVTASSENGLETTH